MAEYLECLMEGLQTMSDKELRVPDRCRLDIGHPSELTALVLRDISLVPSH